MSDHIIITCENGHRNWMLKSEADSWQAQAAYCSTCNAPLYPAAASASLPVDPTERLAELEALFDLRWKADMQAIERWRKAHPESPFVWPDHTDMVVWLIAALDHGTKP